jgi:hypothetical protein
MNIILKGKLGAHISRNIYVVQLFGICVIVDFTENWDPTKGKERGGTWRRLKESRCKLLLLFNKMMNYNYTSRPKVASLSGRTRTSVAL